MPIASINNTKIDYLDLGSGKPLLFIHGLGASYKMFEPQIHTFKKTHRVICPNTRGNGKSGTLNEAIDQILNIQCDDIAALIRELNLEKVVMCGVSYGGVFTYHFVLKYPELIEAIIIVDSFGDTKIVGITEGLLMLSQALTSWAYYLPTTWLSQLIKFQYNKWPLAQKHLIHLVKTMRKRETFLQRKAINKENHTDLLHTVRCPALGIVGNYTKIGVKYMERSINEIQNSKLVIVDQSFDPTNLCQSESFNTIVYNYLDALGWR